MTVLAGGGHLIVVEVEKILLVVLGAQKIQHLCK